MSVPAEQEQQHKQRVREQFGRHAQGYVESVRHRTGRDLERLVELAECRASDVALDIATGGGHTALALAPHVTRVVASDLTPAMLAAAEEFIRSQGIDNVTFEVAEAERLPFANESFDIVSCRVAPHHFADPIAYVNEVARVLRSKGRFVMMDSVAPQDAQLDQFINRVEKWRDPTHVRSYTAQEWRTWIDATGLLVDAWEPVNRRYEFQDWAMRSGMQPDDRDALEQFMLAAPTATQAAFEVQLTEDGRVQSFLDGKFLMRARKP
jgi:ubiquinone/menaquinone biosynthesis C-methylase UbiE